MSCAVQHGGDLGAEKVSGASVRVLDIRGTRVNTAVAPVLADPTGVRARRLARAGRAVAFLCLLWLVGLGLAGIGILPADDLPLGRAITGAAPEVLGIAPVPAPRRFDPAGGRASGTGAASTAAERADRIRSRANAATLGTRHATSPGESESGAFGRSPARSPTRRAVLRLPGPGSGARGTSTSGETTTGSSAAPSGASQAAPAGVSNSGIHAAGRGTVSAPGATVKAATPGHTGTTTRGNAGSGPGQVNPAATAVTTLPGQSGSSPGHTVTTGGGHGNST